MYGDIMAQGAQAYMQGGGMAMGALNALKSIMAVREKEKDRKSDIQKTLMGHESIAKYMLSQQQGGQEMLAGLDDDTKYSENIIKMLKADAATSSSPTSLSFKVSPQTLAYAKRHGRTLKPYMNIEAVTKMSETTMMNLQDKAMDIEEQYPAYFEMLKAEGVRSTAQGLKVLKDQGVPHEDAVLILEAYNKT